VCGAQVALTLCSNTSNGVLLNIYQSKNTLREFIINNHETTGLVMSFLSYAIGCIFKHSKTSKYVNSLLIYYETKSHQPQFIKNINGVKSLVDEIFNINEQFPFAQHENDYKLQFFVCS